MAETKETKKTEVKKEAPKQSAPSSAKPEAKKELKRNTSKVRSGKRGQRKGKGKGNKNEKKGDGFDTKIVKIRRVTRMFKGGRRMRLSVVVVIGDGKGKVGVGVGKGADVRAAQDKAISNAKKRLIQVKLKGNTIPHDIKHKLGAAEVLLKPAAPGTGVVAGSSMRMVAEVAGIKDVLGKIIGTSNPISNAYATVEALDKLRDTRL